MQTPLQLRNRFLRNVFGLLALSLAVAAGAGVAVLAAPPDVASRLLLSQPWALHLTLVLSIGTLLLLALSERLRRPHPHSLLAFVAFSAGQTLLVATATVALDTCLLVQAVGLAALALACVAACAQLLGRLADLTTGAAIAWCSAGVVLGWAGGAALEAVVAGSAGSGASGIGLCCCSWPPWSCGPSSSRGAIVAGGTAITAVPPVRRADLTAIWSWYPGSPQYVSYQVRLLPTGSLERGGGRECRAGEDTGTGGSNSNQRDMEARQDFAVARKQQQRWEYCHIRRREDKKCGTQDSTSPRLSRTQGSPFHADIAFITLTDL
ncbi:hypothetical protein Vafri_10666 [Volvox africanus]|uniref:Uncharacterized protein n=1 Tax=Volvox africanus TaxID=51714 RepID=A0A8J4B6B8_9CHLO|nr:hypothetical protein Vafri_10666 [Volvox africanus]